MKVRFEWKNVPDMTDVNLDHRVSTLKAFNAFFSPKHPEPLATEWEEEKE